MKWRLQLHVIRIGKLYHPHVTVTMADGTEKEFTGKSFEDSDECQARLRFMAKTVTDLFGNLGLSDNVGEA